MSASRTLRCLVPVIGLFLAVGCQSATPGSAAATPQRALVTTTGQGDTTVFIPDGGAGVKMLSASATPACPDCEAAAVKYFQTGEAPAAVCPTCGARRSALSSHN